MIISKPKLDSAILLELAMSYDFSEDVKTNASTINRKIFERFNLDFIGCWQKENSASNNCFPRYIYPHKFKCNIIQSVSFIEEFEQKDFIITNETEAIGKELLGLINREKGNVLLFNTSFMFIFLFRKEQYFTMDEGAFLKNQMNQFSDFIQSKFQQNLLCEKLEAFKIKEKHILETNQLVRNNQQATKEELIKTKSRFSILYKNMEDGILIYNYISKEIIDCNNSAFEKFGYKKREDLFGLKHTSFIPQFSNLFPNIDIHEYIRGHGIKVLKGESVEKTLGIFKKSNGEEFLVEANVIPTHQEKGEAFIIFRDNTKRILAQKELKLRENRYRQIFENSHEAIIYFDIKEQKIVDCNHQALKLFEIENKKIFFQTNFENFYSDKETGIKAFDFFQKQMEISIEKGNCNFHFLAKTLKNNTFRAEGNVIAEVGQKGARRLVFFVRDITEQYDNRVELQLQHQKLKKYIDSNMQLENFAYVASHDLQTPLRTTISFTQLLKRSLKGKVNESESEYMDFIIKATKNMQDLIQDLLNFSHVNNTQNDLKEIDALEVLSEIVEEAQFDIKEKHANIEFPETTMLVNADVFKLKQVFQNLLTNGLKFARPNIPPLIKISFGESSTHWNFTFEDNGIGIEPQYKEKIFLLFKRLHGKNEYEGTGIGLAMCKKIVEQHRGEIWLESVFGEGTTFHFSIKKKIKK